MNTTCNTLGIYTIPSNLFTDFYSYKPSEISTLTDTDLGGFYSPFFSYV